MEKLAITVILLSAGAWAATWSGTLSDANCGAKHGGASEKSINCVKTCVSKGAAPVFVTGDKVLKIANPKAFLPAYLGHKVELTGELDGDTVTVSKVKLSKVKTDESH